MTIIETELDTTVDWYIIDISREVRFPVSYTVLDHEVTLGLHISPRQMFVIMNVIQDDETVFNKKIKAGVQYVINETFIVYFQDILFHPYNVASERDFGTKVTFIYREI